MSTRVILYIAASLDGYIALPDGSVDWLNSYDDTGEDYSYNELIEATGAVVMGSGTYDFLDGIEQWPYEGLPAWVFTTRNLKTFEGADIRLTDASPSEVIAEIAESAGGKAIWLIGGGNLIAQFLDAELIDEVIHFVVPKALGSGIPLYPEPVLDPFAVESAKVWRSGLVELRYRPGYKRSED